MRTKLTFTVAALAVLLFAQSAKATVLGLGDAIGFLVNGEPANPTDELTYIKNMAAFASGGANPSTVGKVYTVINTGSYPEPKSDTQIPGSANTFDVTGQLYVLVKYGGGSVGADYIWYVGGLTSVTVPATIHKSGPGNGQLAISHHTLAVPEPSTYIAGALLLLPFGASVVRRMRKTQVA